MKRRGFLGSIVGLFAAPALPAAQPIAQTWAYATGPDFGDRWYIDESAAYRACNPPAIVDNDGEFIRMYRDEFVAGFDARSR